MAAKGLSAKKLGGIIKIKHWPNRPVYAVSLSTIFFLLLLFPVLLWSKHGSSSSSGNPKLVNLQSPPVLEVAKTQTRPSSENSSTSESSSQSLDPLKKSPEINSSVFGRGARFTPAPSPSFPDKSANQDNKEPFSCPVTTDKGPQYHINPFSYKKPEIYEEKDEVLECSCSHWRTNVCTLKGDVRVDASKNYVMLYAKKGSTKRGVQLMKPYPRKWEVDMMLGVHDVIIKSVDAPPGLQAWKPTNPKPYRTKPQKASSNIKFMRRSRHWSEQKWKASLAKRLSPSETQLSKLEWVRETAGQNLADMGGVLHRVGKHGWVVFNQSKRVTVEEMRQTNPVLKCDVNHSVPGILFANSGWTGNIYHEFNEGLIPLYITAHAFGGEFVMVATQAKLWWFVKYEKVLRQLSNYPVVLVGQENYVHCFSHLIVGLWVHDELSVYEQLLPKPNGSTILFQEKLKLGWGSESLAKFRPGQSPKPVMSILSRSDKTRVITNENELVLTAQRLGFVVQVLNPGYNATFEPLLHKLQTSDLMIGVHGAAMTHFLFMKPNSSFVQILPLGTVWPGRTYYGDPAIRLGLHYLEYIIDIEESSLSKEYPHNHTVLVNPDSVRLEKGWWEFKEIFLERQNVTLNMRKMETFLVDVLKQFKSHSGQFN